MKYKKRFEMPIEIFDQKTGYSKNVILKTIELPNGLIDTFFITKDQDSVQILPITIDEKIITVVQFRPAREEEDCELPGGGLDEGESPIVGALRELEEETGYTSSNIMHVATIPYSPYSTGKRYFFIALDCVKTREGQNLDPNEFLKLKIWDMVPFRNEIMKGKIRGGDGCYMAFDKLKML